MEKSIMVDQAERIETMTGVISAYGDSGLSAKDIALFIERAVEDATAAAASKP
jgi:hypothetical protein